MAFDLLTSRSVETKQYQQQVGVSGSGGDTLGIGAGTRGNISVGSSGFTGNIGKGAVVTIARTPEVEMKALESNQALSTLAITSANQNAVNALQTLQNLGGTFATLAAGGSSAEVAAVSTGETAPPVISSVLNNKTLIITGALVVLGIVAFVVYQNR